jgi:glutamate N-acetyltransferase/amino-acid N-acetyltransferase
LNLPLGYRYSSVFAGIRKVEKDDLGLIVSDTPAAAAGVFTQNRVVASPVKLCRAHLKKSRGTVKAVLVNAGNANCATKTGDAVALTSCEALAKRFKVATEQVLPASTGVIGVELNPRLITKALPALVRGLDPGRFEDVARAMMTTDLAMKVAARELELKQGIVHIAGMTKGSGMIHPYMATTIGFVMTDALLSAGALKDILRAGIETSYNRISVDSDTSTNDTVVLLANGASGVKPKAKESEELQEAVADLLADLAKQIVRDGEGARKFVEIQVDGAVDDKAAEHIARAIANSPLVKTAIAGADPNWGRVLSAAGNARIDFNPSKVNIEMQGMLVCEGGVAADFPEADLKTKLGEAECLIHFVIKGKHKGKARFWTCDFTERYIEINASYRT